MGSPTWGVMPAAAARHAKPLLQRKPTQRQEARLRRSYARLDSRFFADTHGTRTDARHAPLPAGKT